MPPMRLSVDYPTVDGVTRPPDKVRPNALLVECYGGLYECE